MYAATGGDGGSGAAQTNLVTATKQLADAAGQLADATSSSSDLGKATTGLAGRASDLASGLGDIDSEYLAVAQQALAGSGDYAKGRDLNRARYTGVQNAEGTATGLAGYAAGVKDGLLGDDGVRTAAATLAAGAGSLKSGLGSINAAVGPDGRIGRDVSALDAGRRTLTDSAQQLHGRRRAARRSGYRGAASNSPRAPTSSPTPSPR